MISKINKDIWFGGECFLLCALISGSLFLPQLNYLSLGISILIIINRNVEDSLCLLMLLLSFSPIFKLQLTGFALFNILIMCVIVKELIQSKGKLPAKVWGPVFILFAYSLAISMSASLPDWVSFVMSLMYGALILYNKKFNLHRVVNYTSIGIVASSVIGLLNDYIPSLNAYLKTARIKISGTSYFRFSGINGNPNYYTVLIGVVIAIFFVFIIKNKARKTDFIFIAVLTFFGILSASNSFFLAYGIIILIFLGSLLRKHPKQLIAVIIFLVIAGFIIIRNLDDSTKTMLFYRLQSVTSEDATVSSITTSRTDRWGLYVEYFISNPIRFFIGDGIGASNLENHATHNYYLEIPYYLGLIGGALYVFSIVRIALSYQHQHIRHSFYEFLPIIYMLIRGFARNLILSEQLIFIVILCTICLFDEDCDGIRISSSDSSLRVKQYI